MSAGWLFPSPQRIPVLGTRRTVGAKLRGQCNFVRRDAAMELRHRNCTMLTPCRLRRLQNLARTERLASRAAMMAALRMKTFHSGVSACTAG